MFIHYVVEKTLDPIDLEKVFKRNLKTRLGQLKQRRVTPRLRKCFQYNECTLHSLSLLLSDVQQTTNLTQHKKPTIKRFLTKKSHLLGFTLLHRSNSLSIIDEIQSQIYLVHELDEIQVSRAPRSRRDSLPHSTRLFDGSKLGRVEELDQTLVSQQNEQVVFELGCTNENEVNKEMDVQKQEQLESDNLTSEILNTSQAILVGCDQVSSSEKVRSVEDKQDLKRYIEDKLKLRIECHSQDEKPCSVVNKLTY